MKYIRMGVAMLAASVSLTACMTVNDQAMIYGAVPPEVMKQRAMETRRFDTGDDRIVLVAATQTLQDLGFTISESSSDVGLLAGSKVRDAQEAGGIAKGILLGVLFGASAMQWDSEQTIHVTLSVTPAQGDRQVDVRVVFDRQMKTNQGAKTASELVADPGIYQEFFNKLSTGVSLEAKAL